MNNRKERIISLFKDLISEFFIRVNFEKNIVSITRIEISSDLKFSRIFVSVYPENKEGEILEILNKKRGEIKKYIGSKTKMKFLPQLEFILDKGEKNRQRIEELLQC